MKSIGKNSLNRYYDLDNKNNTLLERKISRELCDPNRIYDAKPMDIGVIKAVRLG